ncbi:MAG TPA: hypothetical protein VEV82_08245 [Actinomycetota bacterium]|nr:hypothetical protein [Actinomycetota bacterium]
MLRRSLPAVLIAAALVVGSPVAQGGPKKPRPKRVTGSFTARALPFPASQATAPAGVNSCLAGIEGVHRTTYEFRAPARGSLKAGLQDFTGDWDLFLTDSDKRIDGSMGDQIVGGSPAAEHVSTNVKKGENISIVACNRLGEPEVNGHLFI